MVANFHVQYLFFSKLLYLTLLLISVTFVVTLVVQRGYGQVYCLQLHNCLYHPLLGFCCWLGNESSQGIGVNGNEFSFMILTPMRACWSMPLQVLWCAICRWREKRYPIVIWPSILASRYTLFTLSHIRRVVSLMLAAFKSLIDLVLSMWQPIKTELWYMDCLEWGGWGNIVWILFPSMERDCMGGKEGHCHQESERQWCCHTWEVWPQASLAAVPAKIPFGGC